MGKLDEAGYKVAFENGCWKITKGAMVLARGVKSGMLYTMQGVEAW